MPLGNSDTCSDSGAALVEMAVVMPLLLLMVLGVGDFGRVHYRAITLSHAARAGAAYGAQGSGHPPVPIICETTSLMRLV